MRTIKIHGKDYVSVNERIKYFRENYKDWGLLTELVSDENGKVIMKASIVNPDGDVKATGYAYEKEGNSNINKTSYLENCETSAWGRALGNFGIGIDASVASYDEVANAIENQETEKPVELNRSAFGKPDIDDGFISNLKTALQNAVNVGYIDAKKSAETMDKAKSKTGQELSAYCDTVLKKLAGMGN